MPHAPDLLYAAVAIRFIGSVLAGPAASWGLELLPRAWRRTTQWLLIAGAAVVAILADLSHRGERLS
jgi:hypothetical protein